MQTNARRGIGGRFRWCVRISAVRKDSILLLALLAVIATLRLWLQAAAMPPYAGLDEVWHVARLAFVAREWRNPTMREPSIPPYLARTISGDPREMPAFGEAREAWPDVVQSRSAIVRERALTAADLTPYVAANYEAQQPSFYYAAAAPLSRLGTRGPVHELRLWRAFSVFWGVMAILAIACIAMQIAGPSGVLAAALLLSLPTWQTLIARASNDALTCAFLAIACAISLRGPRTKAGWIAESVMWCFALLPKLYSWPAVIVLPLLWRQQDAPRARRILNAAAVAAAVLITTIDLATRTNNPLGLFAFDDVVPQARGSLAQIDFGSMLRIVIATAVWTSGQHWNALRPAAMLLYFGPLLAIVAWYAIRHRASARPQLQVALVAIGGFAFAQAINAAGYIRQALATGGTLPAGGKEGWYWYALAPLLIVFLSIPLRVAPKIWIVALVAWVVGWDVLIHEGALFQDYAGLTHATGGDALFRWGPRALPFAWGSLDGIGVGPGAGSIAILRMMELALLVLLTSIVIKRRART
jgi:hypothetical protein